MPYHNVTTSFQLYFSLLDNDIFFPLVSGIRSVVFSMNLYCVQMNYGYQSPRKFTSEAADFFCVRDEAHTCFVFVLKG